MHGGGSAVYWGKKQVLDFRKTRLQCQLHLLPLVLGKLLSKAPFHHPGARNTTYSKG